MTTPTEKGPARPGDEQFAEDARKLFDASVERLDAATLSKLNRGRQAALAEVSSRSSAGQWLHWLPAAGIAAAVTVAVIMLQGPAVTTLPGASDTLADDFEILFGDDDLEMIEELEFYSWIELADATVPDNVG